MAMQTMTRPDDATIERLVAMGDLEGLQPYERARHYIRVCESLGLNPQTQPFLYTKLNGKLVMYAKKDATDQLRRIYSVAVTIASRDNTSDLCIVTARATTPDGRTDESIGAVSIAGLKGENLANALMKAETKAKRRVTLSICGLGWLDETEVSDVKSSRPVTVTADGEIIDERPPSEPDLTKQLAASVDWVKWRNGHEDAMKNAPDLGSLNAAWADFNDDPIRREVAQEHVDHLRVIKDAMKVSLKEGGSK